MYFDPKSPTRPQASRKNGWPHWVPHVGEYPCGYCQARVPETTIILRCGRCRAVWYCNGTCKAAHAGSHSLECTSGRKWVPVLVPASGPTHDALIQAAFTGRPLTMTFLTRTDDERLPIGAWQLTWLELASVMARAETVHNASVPDLQRLLAFLEDRHLLPWSQVVTPWEHFVAAYLVRDRSLFLLSGPIRSVKRDPIALRLFTDTGLKALSFRFLPHVLCTDHWELRNYLPFDSEDHLQPQYRPRSHTPTCVLILMNMMVDEEERVRLARSWYSLSESAKMARVCGGSKTAITTLRQGLADIMYRRRAHRLAWMWACVAHHK